MKFRPCIDIHNGKVKQIVGGSLADKNNSAEENFVSEYDAAFYAELYRKNNLKGGHIIILNPAGSEFYDADNAQAKAAMLAYPFGFQIGGGITCFNAEDYLKQGASHVIVTSYVFKNGKINLDNLRSLVYITGKDRLVLDLSCRKKNDNYYIVTDRWQNFTDVIINEETIDMLSEYCDEFLIHAVDVEGKANGIEKELVELLGNKQTVPMTYAGGIGSYTDLERLKVLGRNRLDFTVGSALDLFGGCLEFDKIKEWN
jgi:phosphoribosylformimino-5-aminoimidazole carboxamide ribotide isomerase